MDFTKIERLRLWTGIGLFVEIKIHYEAVVAYADGKDFVQTDNVVIFGVIERIDE